MKKHKFPLNLPLIIGSIILIILFIMMLFPDLFITKSPYTISQLRFLHDNGELTVLKAPYPPSKEFLMGSDDLGRDIWSYIVYGTRLTIFLGVFVALGQFLIAIPMAFFAGFGHKTIKSIIAQLNILFSAIPALLISIIVLQLNFFANLNKYYSILSFVIVLTFVGWPKLGYLMMERVEAINRQPFIKGEVALGKTRRKIAVMNILPHLAPEIIVLFFMEIARNLTVIMQLGVFSVFIGNLKIVKDSDMGQLIYYNVSFEPEWASMLSTSRTMISVAPWAVIFPAMAFFITVLGFNLFGEGLRHIVQRKNSHIIPTLRKILTLDYKYFKNNLSKKIKIRIAVILSIMITSSMLVTYNNNAQYDFHTNKLLDDLSEEVIIGTKEAESSADIIKDHMLRLGIEPLEKYDYVIPYETEKMFKIVSQELELKVSGIQFEGNKDFTFITSTTNSVNGLMYDATKIDFSSLTDYQFLEDKFVVINKTYYNDSLLNYYIQEIIEHVSIKGVFLLGGKNESMSSPIVNEQGGIPILLMSHDAGNILLEHLDEIVTIKATLEPLNTQGNNVVGIYKGTDSNMSDEAILIGMGYNYISSDGKDILSFSLSLMEALTTLDTNQRSIIFMFMDGTISEDSHGIYPLSQRFPYSSQKIKAFINLSGIKSSSFDEVSFSMVQAPITRQFAWSIGHYLENELKKEKIVLRELDTISISNEYYFTESNTNNVMFWDRGVATIILETKEGQRHHIDELGSILLEVINKNNY